MVTVLCACNWWDDYSRKTAQKQQSTRAAGLTLGKRGPHHVNLVQLVILPFVVVNTTRPPALVGAETRRADYFQQPAVRAERSHIFVVGKLIRAGFHRPAI